MTLSSAFSKALSRRYTASVHARRGACAQSHLPACVHVDARVPYVYQHACWEHKLGTQVGNTSWEHMLGTHVGNTCWEHMLGTHVETFHLASVTETVSYHMYHMYHMSVCNPQPEEKWHTSCDVTRFTQVRDVTLV
jgi:hypothetical protein